MLHIYNTLNRQKELFTPITENRVRMYVCGMTVYDYCHLGHARVLVVFDMVARYLAASGYDVNYVRNITDIDDKIIVRANKNGEPFLELTERFIDAMHDDAGYLGVLPPTQEPKATHHIGDIIAMVQALIEKGFAYQGVGGDVYYSVRKFEGYGKLSGKKMDEMRVGARVEENTDKQDPLDFVLWKQAKAGEPAWASPWGEGRPGWHIECSAMSKHCLGDHFDIHAGGMDLQFPHHENEIAQSEAANGSCFSNYWMHNGYVQIDKEKMSKSLGNFTTIREILTLGTKPEFMGEVLRFLMLSAHYRSPLNYSMEALDNAKQGLSRLYKIKQRQSEMDIAAPAADCSWMTRFKEAMDDDFNTAVALSVLFELGREINRLLDKNSDQVLALWPAFAQQMHILGLGINDPVQFLGGEVNHSQVLESTGFSADEIEQKVQNRVTAKAEKDWAIADQIRDELVTLGVKLEDKPDGSTHWKLS